MTKKEGTFDKDLIRELAELLDETGLTEIEIEHEGKRVRVARTVTVGASAISVDAGRSAREPGERGGKRQGCERDQGKESHEDGFRFAGFRRGSRKCCCKTRRKGHPGGTWLVAGRSSGASR